MILSQNQITVLFTGDIVEHAEPVRPSHTQVFDDGSRIIIKPYGNTRTYAAQLEHGKKATCRVHVLGCWLDSTATSWCLRLQIARTRQEPALLLGPSGGKQRGRDENDPIAHGYTDIPSRALRGEPEAIDEHTLTQYSKQARERHEAFMATLDQRPIHEQLAYELQRASVVGVDATHQLMAIQRRIRSLRRKIDQRAA